MSGKKLPAVLKTVGFILILGAVTLPVAAQAGVPVSDQARIEMGRSLVWYHTCPGDYNQDGLVNASDITPLGASLNESALPDEFPSHLQFALIDGDRNGMITVADLTAIGANFGCDVLGGYNVYAADSQDEYPTSNTAPSKPNAYLMGHVALADTTTPAGQVADYDERKVLARKRFAFDVEYPLEHRYWWVRPVDKNGNEGTPSEMVVDPGANVPRDDLSAAVASWDSQTFTLSWYYYHCGDYNLDGFVDISDLTQLTVYFGETVSSDENSASYIADGDRSGVIDAGDIEVIEQHLNSAVVGYAIYASASLASYPNTNDASSALEPIATIGYNSWNYAEQAQYRSLISIELPDITANTYLWVRPYDLFGYEGTPSNLVQVE
ncbi:hypothetical protein JW859_02390 [bacterium]|nr:hypothetical protein [bacterium]